MTAQAGAAAAWISEYNIGVLREYAADGYSAHVEICNARNLTDTIPLYTAPPAAVSVEALEELVDALICEQAIEIASEHCRDVLTHFGWNGKDGMIPFIQQKTSAAILNATTLIKERSNG